MGGGGALVGRFYSRSGEAMTLGVLFGPVGLVMTFLLVGRAVGRQGRWSCRYVIPAAASAEDGPPIDWARPRSDLGVAFGAD